MQRKICIVTGSRAEYGLLKPVIQKCHEDHNVELMLLVTGMHLSPEFGLTIDQIKSDGYPISKTSEMLLSSDTPAGISKSMGLALICFADIFEELKPHLLVLLGDRFEALAVATSACTFNIPIAHIHGGETTEGAMDESFRHAITKMSHIHFTSNEMHKKRVCQLGENPDFVYNTGAIAVQTIKNLKEIDDPDLQSFLGFNPNDPFFLVTYHPVTLEQKTAVQQFNMLWQALEHFKDHIIIFTKSNADAEGRIINKIIDERAVEFPEKVKVFTSMGQERYFAAVRKCKAVIGNSSSGLIEVPSLGVPTVNIGNRQKGRMRGDSVIDTTNDTQDIINAVNRSMESDFLKICQSGENPYEGSDTADFIFRTIRDIPLNTFRTKPFFDL